MIFWIRVAASPLLRLLTTSSAPSARVQPFALLCAIAAGFHATPFVADGQWSTIGSMNFDDPAMALDDDSTLMILDATICGQMS